MTRYCKFCAHERSLEGLQFSIYITNHNINLQSSTMEQVSGGVTRPATIVEVGPSDTVPGYNDGRPSITLDIEFVAEQDGTALRVNAVTNLQ